MADKKPPVKRKPRPKPTTALDFTVWAVDGSTIPEAAVAEFEAAIQAVQVKLFNEGVRCLTQTTKG
jgi:hypothetical protein